MTVLSELGTIVDWEKGLVSPAIHFDDEVYREEQKLVFGRSWLVVGHEDMIRKPGDYVSNYMGEVPVVVLRDNKNQIRVLINKCSHRGNQVCLFDRGNTQSFTCSYHGWTFGLEGELMGVPMEQPFYRGELNKENWGLAELPSVANFNGLIFASFDPHAPAIEKWLGEDVSWWLENFVLASPTGGLEALPGWHRYRSPGNWKLVSENFIGDDYHVFAATHVSWLHVIREFLDQGILIPIVTYPGSPTRQVFEGSVGGGEGGPLGLGMIVLDDSIYQRDLEEAEQLGPESVEWIKERHDRIQKVLTERDSKPYSFMNGLLFPNFGLMGFFSAMLGRHFLQFHPRGPMEHEVWQWTMVEREAPQAVKELAVQRVYQGQHMAGLIAPDDVENFERMVESSRASQVWDRPFNYGLQLGHEHEGPNSLPGNIGPNPSEFNQRQFYKFWLKQMQANRAPAAKE